MNFKKNLVNKVIVEIFNEVLEFQERALRKNGINLSISEVHTLEAISKSKENNRMSQIAELLNITPSTLSININRLSKKGFVIKQKDKFDKRVIHLILSDSAKEVLTVHDKFHHELVNSLFDDLKMDEDDVLLNSLERVVEHLKNYNHKKNYIK